MICQYCAEPATVIAVEIEEVCDGCVDIHGIPKTTRGEVPVCNGCLSLGETLDSCNGHDCATWSHVATLPLPEDVAS